MEHNWIIKKEPTESKVNALQIDLGIPKSISRLLVSRDICSFDEAKYFFRPSLEDLHDPFLLKDMDSAVQCMLEVISKKGKIVVYGDYDVDGTTSVAMMSHFLKNYSSCEIVNYIPDRYQEGYGISEKFVESIVNENVDLVITLDCGIRAVSLIDRIVKMNSKIIICDHHEPGAELPPANAILDPKRPDCPYPFKGLSGCGVGFKLIQALIPEMGLDSSVAFQYLDLLTISIGADIVPLNGENRILAYYGLKEINENPRLGIQLVLARVGLKKSELTISDVVFTLAPRINAAGRIDHAIAAVQLLMAQHKEEAEEICEKIEAYNKERKAIDKTITAEALEKIEQDPFYTNSNSTVIWEKNWHKGVIGIVASRIIEKHYKPTIVLTEKEGIATGSARSIKGIDIHQALNESSELLERHGGHTMAAGLTIKSENLTEFRTQFEKVISKKTKHLKLHSEIIIDAEISFKEIDAKFYRLLSQFAPFGPSNMTPVFITRNVKDGGYSKLVGDTKDHVKFSLLEIETDTYISGIGFKQAHHWPLIKSGKPFDIAYAVTLNEWNGNKTLQLEIRDIKEPLN